MWAGFVRAIVRLVEPDREPLLEQLHELRNIPHQCVLSISPRHSLRTIRLQLRFDDLQPRHLIPRWTWMQDMKSSEQLIIRNERLPRHLHQDMKMVGKDCIRDNPNAAAVRHLPQLFAQHILCKVIKQHLPIHGPSHAVIDSLTLLRHDLDATPSHAANPSLFTSIAKRPNTPNEVCPYSPIPIFACPSSFDQGQAIVVAHQITPVGEIWLVRIRDRYIQSLQITTNHPRETENESRCLSWRTQQDLCRISPIGQCNQSHFHHVRPRCRFGARYCVEPLWRAQARNTLKRAHRQCDGILHICRRSRLVAVSNTYQLLSQSPLPCHSNQSVPLVIGLIPNDFTLNPLQAITSGGSN